MVKYPNIQGQQCRGGGEDTASQAGAKQVIGASSCDATKLSERHRLLHGRCKSSIFQYFHGHCKLLPQRGKHDGKGQKVREEKTTD